MSSVRTVEGCDLASEEPGREHRDVLARDRQNVCHGSEKDGKLDALQREISRRDARGSLRADILSLECHPRDRKFIKRPHILWLSLRRLECES